MKKDQTLKTEEHKMVFLMAGNSGVGKKNIIKQWKSNILNHNYQFLSEGNESYYTSYNFDFEETIENTKINFTIEIRVLNGDELETEIKSKMKYFKGAYGAFIVTSIDDFMSFQE
jgi:hypothetical protein